MRRIISRLATISFLLLSLSSCSPRLTLLASPEAAEVGDLVMQSAKATKGLAGLVVAPDSSPWPGSGFVVRLTSTPRWNLPPEAPKLAPIPSVALPSTYAPLPAFADLGRAKDGSWSAVPLFFDVVGVEAYYREGSSTAPELPAFDQIGDRRWAGLVALPGGLPVFRQAVFFLQESTPKSPLSDIGNWFMQDDGAWREGLARISDVTTAGAWVPSTWTFAPGDLAIWQNPGSPYVLGTTYREFEVTRGVAPRRFIAWQRRYDAGRTALAGTALFLEVFGDGKAVGQLKPLLKLLCSPEFQIQVGVRLKWMAVSQSTAEIDGDSAAIRDEVRGALRFFPLAGRLPATVPSNNLMGEIQAAFNFAKKR